MPLILPPHLRAAYRPLQHVSTVDLMQELHWRDTLHELSGSLAMGSDPADVISPEVYEQLRQLQLAELLRQLGVAVGSSGRCLLLGERTPDPTSRSGFREILHAKVIICKHPNLDPAEQQQIVWSPGPRGGPPAQGLMEPTPASPTSSPSGDASPPAQACGPANMTLPFDGSGS